MIHALGLLHREQIKFADKPTFPDGTEPLYDTDKKLIGYRIKKGVLGITKDIEVILGPEPNREASFQARRNAGNRTSPVENTYDRYMKLMHEEADLCRHAPHVVLEKDEPWESTKWPQRTHSTQKRIGPVGGVLQYARIGDKDY